MILPYIYHIIMYIMLIGLLHYLYNFFRNNLTTPKIIDLVKRPTNEYKKMYNTIYQSNHSNYSGDTSDNTHDMKKELKNYFKQLNKEQHTSTTTPKSNNKIPIYSDVSTSHSTIPFSTL